MTDLTGPVLNRKRAGEGILVSGLPDPVDDAQRIFRSALTALSEPGRVLQLPVALESVCRQLGGAVGPAALGLLLALADGDTPIWLDRKASPVAAFLGFHTGAPIVERPMESRFALIADPAAGPNLAAFDRGSVDYPDRSATVIMEVGHVLSGGQIGFSGPGIPTRRYLAIEGLPANFIADWASNRSLFPCGIDVLLSCGDRFLGLPRSTALEVSCM
jgi:alpha-D-ribose 1-methylphosphonate 5-triphosphate synthase subunit PhnH